MYKIFKVFVYLVFRYFHFKFIFTQNLKLIKIHFKDHYFNLKFLRLIYLI